MNYYNYLFFTLLLLLGRIGGNVGNSKVPVQWYCANEDCSEPISSAEPHYTYRPDIYGKVHLVQQDKVNVFKKPVDKNVVHLWFVEVIGKEKGYVSPKNLRETKTLVKKDHLVVVNDEIDRKFVESPYSLPKHNEVKEEESKPFESVKTAPQKDYNNENGDIQEDGTTDQNLSGEYSSQVDTTHFAENTKSGETLDQSERSENPSNVATEGKVTPNPGITDTDDPQNSVGQKHDEQSALRQQLSTVEGAKLDEVNQTAAGELNSTVELANSTLHGQINDQFTQLNQNVSSETGSPTGPATNVDKSTDVQSNQAPAIENTDLESSIDQGQVSPVPAITQTSDSEVSVSKNTTFDGQPNPMDNSTVEGAKLDEFNQTSANFDQQVEENSTVEVVDSTLSEQMYDKSTALNQNGNSEAPKNPDTIINSENPAFSQTYEHSKQLETAKAATHSQPSDLQSGEVHSIRTIPNEINEMEHKEVYISGPVTNSFENQAQYGVVNDQNIGPSQFNEKASTIGESNKVDELRQSVEKPVENAETVNNNLYQVGTDDPKMSATVGGDGSQAETKVEETRGQNVPPTSANQPEQEQTENSDNKIDEDVQASNWFSPIYSVINSCKEMFSSSDIKNQELLKVSDTGSPEELVGEQHVENNIQSAGSSNEEAELPSDAHCDKEEELCNSVDKYAVEDDGNYVTVDPEISTNSIGIDNLSGVTVFINHHSLLIIAAFVVLLFSLGYYYIENSRRDGDLVAEINSLERELFVRKKEQGMVDDQLSKARDTISHLTHKVAEQDEFVDRLQGELQENKTKQLTLEDTVSRQEKEIEMLMENGLEMHRLLSETISDEDRSQILLNNIAELKESLTERLNENISLTEQLDQKNQEIQLLKLDIKSSSDKQHDLEQKLINAHRDIEDKIFQATEPLKEQIMKLEQNIADKTSEHTHLESELAQLKCECDTWNARCMSAERGLRDAHGVSSSDAFNKWVNASEVHATLAAAEKKLNALNEEKQSILVSKTDLEAKLDDLRTEVSSLNEKYERVEKEKIEALTKLKVLSNYFSEKETQLQEELGLKEAQWLQKQSEGDTIYEQMRALREENLSYRSQNEMLKKEIIEQEASLKKQITSEEQKAHENWVALRQAERRLKEVQLEASQLRNRLTALESTANHSGDGQLSPNGLEPNGESPYPQAASPPFILYPREFMPPPPLASATPTRPPPLGRISSPPIPVDFTPPPPLMPYEFFPPPSPPPPVPAPPPHLHKPQPRDAKREQKESFSSNYSSESATDKPARRGKR